MAKQPAEDQQAELIAKAQRYLMPNYAQKSVVLCAGEGVWLRDVANHEYIDFASGIAVTALGHQHPALVAAAKAALDQPWHVSNVFYNEPAILLAELLVEKLGFPGQVFFANSGGEANEAAIKLVRRYHWLAAGQQAGAAPRHQIVSFRGGFHGRTLATVTATAQPKYHEGFAPLPEGFIYTEASEAGLAAITDRTAAVIIEPIQGEGGVRPVSAQFLRALRQRCEAMGALLVVDEIQTGFCRTGKWFGFQHADIMPDIVTTAKALGGGLPIGAMIARPEIAAALTPGSHGSTFGGNPVICRVALAMIAELTKMDANSRVREIEALAKAALMTINNRYHVFADIRGQGVMLGAELAERYHGRAGELVSHAATQGLLTLVAGTDVLRLHIPMIIADSDLAAGFAKLDRAIAQLTKTAGLDDSSSISMSQYQ